MLTRIFSLASLLVAGLNLAFVEPCMAQAGDLDPGFGDGGKVVTDFPMARRADLDLPTPSYVQPDGKTIVAHENWLARLNADGTPDLSFGDAGEVLLDFRRGSLEAVHGGPDGTVIVAGHAVFASSSIASYDWVIARFDADGRPDTSFGNAGLVTADFGAGSVYPDDGGTGDVLEEIVVLPDGRILAIGLSSDGVDYSIALMRFRADGRVDTSFGQSGRVRFGIDALGTLASASRDRSFFLSVARQSDGKILLASLATSVSTNDTLYVFRLDVDGIPDLTFGVNGVAAYVKAAYPFPEMGAIAVRPDGKIFVLAHMNFDGWNNDPTVLALNPDGSFDTQFGTAGVLTISLGAYEDDPPSFDLLSIAPNGGPIIAGTRVRYELSTGSDIVKLYYNEMAAMKLNPDGSVDSLFGVDGLATVSIYEYHREMYARSLTTLDDGKLILCGPIKHFPDGVFEFNSEDVATVRLEANGMLDPGFGSDGTAFLTGHSPGGNTAKDLVLTQADGKIVVAGSAEDDQNLLDFALARYHADGSLDQSFGDRGRVMTDLQSSNEDWAVVGGTWGRSNDTANAMIMQPDGKIVVAGESFLSYPYFPSYRQYDSFALVRYRQDGTLDPEFGVEGIVLTGFLNNLGRGELGRATDLTLQDDGKIIAVGHVRNRPPGGAYEEEFVIVRYNPDGTIDSSFGELGIVRVNRLFRHDEYARSVIVQPDGKILVAGYYVHHQFWIDDDGIEVVRLNPDGSLDDSFGEGGILLQDIGAGSGPNSHSDDLFEIELLPDGRMLVGGSALVDGSWDMILARYLPDGSPDVSFGVNGMATLDFSENLPGSLGGTDEIFSLERQSDGRIVVAGYTGRLVENPVPREKHLYRYVVSYDFALARFEENGSLDYSFGYGGKVTTSFGSPVNAAYSVGIQVDGKIVAVGQTRYDDSTGYYPFRYSDIAVARYQGVNSQVDEIEALIFHTQDLVGLGSINEGQANSLQSKLQAAVHQVDRGNYGSAVRQLQAFRAELISLRDAGRISESQAAFLVEEVGALIDLLSGQ